VKLPEKSKFLGNLPLKIEILLTRIQDPQISNQIDATDEMTSNRISLFLTLLNPDCSFTLQHCWYSFSWIVIISPNVLSRGNFSLK